MTLQDRVALAVAALAAMLASSGLPPPLLWLAQPVAAWFLGRNLGHAVLLLWHRRQR